MFLKLVRLAAGLIISGVALYYFIQVTPDGFFKKASSHSSAILLGFTVLVPVYILRAVKFLFIVKAPKKQFVQISAAQYAGIALNNILPFRLGDILRLAYMNKAMKFKLPVCVISLLVERITDLLTILFLAALFILAFEFELLVSTVVFFKIVIMLLLATIVIISMLFYKFKVQRERFFQFITHQFRDFDFSVKRLSRLAALSLCQWILEILALGAFLSYIIFGSVTSKQILSTFASNLSTLIPSAPGYIGTFEAAGMLPFIHFDVNNLVLASVFVVVLHASIWLFSTILGLLSLAFLPQFIKHAQSK